LRVKGGNGWKDATLEELVFFQRGYDITKSQQKSGLVPVISSSGVSSFHDEAMAPGPGVVVGRKGTIGSIHLSQVDYWPHDTTLWSRNLKGNDARFVYYYLHTIDLKRFDVGNSNPTINRNHIHKIPVRIPPHEVQSEIADRLSLFDKLIENNRRRIALLEESARLLYREWFVHLRFPGHEHVKVVDGVPEGWKLVPLEAVAKLNYGKALKEEHRIPGNYPVYGSSGVVGYHQLPVSAGPGIIVGRKGNVGAVYWSSGGFFAIDTAYFVAADQSNLHLYYALRNVTFMSTDVSVPGLNRDFAHSIKLLIPADKLKKEFIDIAASQHDQIENLNRHNQKLSEARDLLLPRLMSGEIQV
jgi:type I restriction enzyme, S subunit